MLSRALQGHRERFGQLADRRGATSQALHHRPAGAIGQGVEDEIHVVRILRHLPEYSGNGLHLSSSPSDEVRLVDHAARQTFAYAVRGAGEDAAVPIVAHTGALH